MAKTTTLPVTQNIKFTGAKIVNATGAVSGESGTAVTGLVDLYTAPADDAVVKSVMATSSDTSSKILQLYVYDGSVSWLIGMITIAAGTGITSGTTVNADVLNNQYLIGLPLDSAGRPVLPMQSGHILRVGVTAAVTAAKTIGVVAFVESYT